MLDTSENQSKTHLSFALDEKGEVRYIDDIQEMNRGLKCKCVCALCGKPLVARIGNKRVRHFAHMASSDADLAEHRDVAIRESTLHKLAKQMLVNCQEFLLPPIVVSVAAMKQNLKNESFADILPSTLQFSDPQIIRLSQISTEHHIANIVPDAVAIANNMGQKYLIEFAVSHFSDAEKIKKIERLGIPAVEVNLNNIDLLSATKEDLEYEILRNPHNRYWLYFPSEGELNKWAEDEFNRIANEKKKEWKQYERKLEIANRIRNKSEEYKEQSKQTNSNFFEQQFDEFGNRRLKCLHCGRYEAASEFVAYGGPGEAMGKGICRKCYKANPSCAEEWGLFCMRVQREC